MKKQMRPIPIRRATKEEMDAAIKDLVENRNFKVIYGPVEMNKEGKHFTRDYFNRKIFLENIQSSWWIAKLQKIEDDENG